jgi:hypothetical protein
MAWADGAPLATTAAGKISGVVEDGVNVFKGIPYQPVVIVTSFGMAQHPRKGDAHGGATTHCRGKVEGLGTPKIGIEIVLFHSDLLLPRAARG